MGTYFPPPGRAEEYCNNAPSWCASVDEARVRITPELSAQLSRTGLSRKAAGDVKYVFVTKAGPGPTRQSAEEHLLDPTSGLPVVPRGLKHRRLRIGDTVESLPSSPPSDLGSNQWLG